MRRLFASDHRLAEVLVLSALIFVVLVLFGLGRPAHAAETHHAVMCAATY